MDGSQPKKNGASHTRPNGQRKSDTDCVVELSASEADIAIVQRCLSGDTAGWEQLYSQQHPRLLKTIGTLFGSNCGDLQLIDEMAARVWFALVRGEARLLARYDPQRHCRLESFLFGLARIEVLRYLRDERRRKIHEFARGHRHLVENSVTHADFSTVIHEFAATLSPAEKEFFEESLIAPLQEQQSLRPKPPLSQTNVWQRRHRIRAKLHEYLTDI